MIKTDAIKLLAIDDKPDNRTALSAVVRDALPWCTILTASSGPAGIELAAAADPDVILLDIVMPGMDGFDVCRRIKADERLNDIPVVFFTALKTDAASRVKALEVGAEGFLTKPLEPAELTAQVRAMAKVKAASRLQRMQKERLEALVAEHTRTVRESESRYRAMFENMAAASCVDEIVYKDGRAVDYQILDVNPAFERITGSRRQEAAGALASAFYGLAQAPFLDVYGRVAETGEPAEFEAWFEPLQKHLHITVGRPKPGFFSTVFTDITARKQMEQQIRGNEARLHSLVRILQHQSTSLQAFLDYALDEAIQLTKSKIGYIYFYSEEKREFTLNTWSNGVMDVCAITEPQTVYQLANTGIWGEAVRRRKEIIVNDFQAPHPLKKGYPEGHAPLHRFLTVPVFSSGQIGAVVGVANKETDYDQSDVLQLMLLMEGVWKEVDRKKGEVALMESEKQLSEQLRELQRWHNVMLDREGRVMELKREVNELLARAGQPPRYSSAEETREK